MVVRVLERITGNPRIGWLSAIESELLSRFVV
jgi:hypothetical protein